MLWADCIFLLLLNHTSKEKKVKAVNLPWQGYRADANNLGHWFWNSFANSASCVYWHLAHLCAPKMEVVSGMCMLFAGCHWIACWMWVLAYYWISWFGTIKCLGKCSNTDWFHFFSHVFSLMLLIPMGVVVWVSAWDRNDDVLLLNRLLFCGQNRSSPHFSASNFLW